MSSEPEQIDSFPYRASYSMPIAGKDFSFHEECTDFATGIRHFVLTMGDHKVLIPISEQVYYSVSRLTLEDYLSELFDAAYLYLGLLNLLAGKFIPSREDMLHRFAYSG
jgi:hypothetical protein